MNQKQHSAAVPNASKKGVVVNRSTNHTINQDVMASNGKWVDVGLGVLKHKVSKPGQYNYAKVGAFGKLVPLTRHQKRFFLKAIEEQETAQAALKAELLDKAA